MSPPKSIILDWIVGDFLPKTLPTIDRHKRNTQRSIAGFSHYAPIYASRTAGAVFEGSGMVPPYTDPSQPTFIEGDGSKLRSMQPITPIEITVSQISNERIPSTAFFSPSGGKLKFRLYEHIYPVQFGLEFKDPSAAIGREIQRDLTGWISFDSIHNILRLRPYPEHVGSHKFVLCAQDEMQNRACSKCRQHKFVFMHKYYQRICISNLKKISCANKIEENIRNVKADLCSATLCSFKKRREGARARRNNAPLI